MRFRPARHYLPHALLALVLGGVGVGAVVTASPTPVDAPPPTPDPVVVEESPSAPTPLLAVVPEPAAPLPPAPPVMPPPQSWPVDVGVLGAEASPTALAFNATEALVVDGTIAHLVYTENGQGRYYRGPVGKLAPVTDWPAAGTASAIGLDADQGRLGMVWTSGGTIRASLAVDGTWGPTVTLGRGVSPDVAVEGDRAVAVWHEGPESSAAVYRAAWDGSSWSPASKMSSAKAAAFATVDLLGDREMVAWRESDDGSSWFIAVAGKRTTTQGKDPSVMLTPTGAEMAYQAVGRVMRSRMVDGEWLPAVEVGRGLFGSVVSADCTDFEAIGGAPTDDAAKRVGLVCDGRAIEVGGLGAVYPAAADIPGGVLVAWVDRASGVVRVEGVAR